MDTFKLQICEPGGLKSTIYGRESISFCHHRSQDAVHMKHEVTHEHHSFHSISLERIVFSTYVSYDGAVSYIVNIC